MGEISQTNFAERIISKLAEAGDSREARFEVEEFRIVFTEEGGECGILNLGNLFSEFQRLEPEHQDRRISEIARAALSHLKPVPDEFQDASYDLRPRIWSRSTLEHMRIRNVISGDDGPNWPVEPIGSNLILSLVYDLPESVRSVGGDELAGWGVSFWEARETAIANLSQDDFVVASLGDALYASNTGDSYDATRLVLTPLTDQFDVDGAMIAMVPNRETLLITGENSEVGITMMVEFAAEELSQNPRPLVASPVVFRDGGWEDWSVPVDHPSHGLFRKIYLGWLQHEYQSQKELLQELGEAKMSDEFLATYTVISKEEQYSSYAVWGKGVKTSLPKTDDVAFMTDIEGGVAAFAKWERVVEICGSMMEEQDVYPPRFLVNEYPSEEQLQQLQS